MVYFYFNAASTSCKMASGVLSVVSTAKAEPPFAINSSPCGISMMSYCDFTMSTFMKWFFSFATRSINCSNVDFKNTNLNVTSGNPHSTMYSRYTFLRIEQEATTVCVAFSFDTASLEQISSSSFNQPHLSSSVKGSPRAILSTLACGCKVSPSTKGHALLSASRDAIVVFPVPAGPPTIRTVAIAKKI
ncbi:hypothetical protein EJF18_60330 [Clavispora lusitaniae]|uniref:Uncharacterized protein n=1 Tax=Clavispora lusitaniae TaxID=36911 RepID=A0ACD0WQR3_CLALS|nr:hypothetical protein EJF14_60330 [Clavispora lusitaniae]QFZ35467.1 hypothetical protein EJF16_60330 [Clavispora lusitaniae]QFZ41161.1 hypothetical protein EJF15_60330 [Clavispora lusitaniae]QFZ46842.1 hypothetical protein EJF18_60330 [Clavispora lusitaniae]QFZ52507.1 hypothetical protein EJF17_60330 [Clavispora lusitaniae]